MNDLLRAFELLDNLRSLLPRPGVVTIGGSDGHPEMLDVNWQWRMPDGRWMHYKGVFDRTLLSRMMSETLEHQLAVYGNEMMLAGLNPPPADQVVE